MAYLYCLRFNLIGLFLLFSGSIAFSFPAERTEFSVSGYSQYIGWHSSSGAACSAMNARDGRFNWVLDGDMCLAGGWSSGIRYSITSRVANSCPANSTQSGNQCTCAAGYVDTGTSCKEKDNDPCELLIQACAGSEGFSTNFRMSGKKAGVSFTCMPPSSVGGELAFPGCSKGCMANVGAFTTAFQDASGAWVTQGTAKYSGASCEPSVINDLNSNSDPEFEPDPDPKVADKPDSSCPNGFKGEFNDVNVCVPPKASSAVTEKEAKDNGDGTKTNTKTEVKCENGKCEVTKTSTVINNSNTTIGGSSSTTTVDKKAFCAENKTSDICKNEKGESEGNGKFGGSCSAGFTCEGDALQCAIAKEQHKRNCEVSDDLLKSDEYKAWQSAKAWDGKSVTGNLPGNREHTISLNVGDDFIGSGSCPSDQTVELPYGLSLTIPFSAMCEWLRLLGHAFVIVAYIIGALIIVRRQS